MAQKLSEVMTRDPITVDAKTPVSDCAKLMKDRAVGDVIVTEDGKVCGIITDRDITIRVIAEGKNPNQIKAGQICTGDMALLTPNDSTEDAVRLMRERAIRRLPVVDDGKPVGIVSLGDLALEKDPKSVLADISAAPPNR